MRLLLLCVLLTVSNAFADPVYQQLVGQIQSHELSWQALQSWSDHPLFPHLQGQWFEHNLADAEIDHVKTFLTNPDHRAASWFLKPKWRTALVERKAWGDLIDQFPSPKSAEEKCDYWQALKELQRPVPVADVQTLWLSGQSRPDACDPFFFALINQHPDRLNLVWERQQKAFYARNGRLLRYLNRFYETDDGRALGAMITRIYDRPTSIVSNNYNPADDRQRTLALAAVNRLAFRDPKSASNLWLALVQKTPEFTGKDIRTASEYLGVAMAKQGMPEADYWLRLADPKGQSEAIQHWRFLIATEAEQYSEVIELYQSLSDQLKNHVEFRYWYGWALFKTQGFIAEDHPWHALAQQRRYYGFLAAAHLNQRAVLNETVGQAPSVAYLAAKPALQRAYLLRESGDLTRAQIEWNLAIRGLPNADQLKAAHLAQTWDWHHKASQSAGWSGQYQRLDLRYPMAFETMVTELAEETRLPSHWIYAVMRQESRYDSHAVSPVGARGLMQLMPATAQRAAKRYGVPYQGVDDLFKPEINIQLGSQYLAQLMRQFNNPIQATAAYNAGPSRVKSWNKRFPEDRRLWVESIPFEETRHYVKSVMAYNQIYAELQNTGWHLAQWFQPDIQIAQLNAPN